MTNTDLKYALKYGTHDEIADVILTVNGEDRAELWQTRTRQMLTKVLRCLCWMRDNQGLTLDGETILEFVSLRRFIDLADPGKHPGIPDTIRSDIVSYLKGLPGFDFSKGYEQRLSTQDMHGYLNMVSAGCLQQAMRES